MKELNPRTPRQNPNGWIRVYDAFRDFRNIAAKTGEPVDGWALFHASSLKEKLTKGWQVRYSIGGLHHEVFIGHDSASAVAGIKEMIKSYPKHKRNFVKVDETPKAKPYDPKLDPHYIMRIFNEWKQTVAKVGHSITPAEYQTTFAPRFKLMKYKAGILNMEMSAYLTNHPHAQYWPVPPLSQEEYRRRQQEYEAIVRRKESQRRQEQGY